MDIIAVNGSPRKGWNTHILLEKALEGAASKGAGTELVNLYELDFKGCVSCFECKRKEGGSKGRCAVRDGLSPLLERINGCKAVIIGSPIYFGEVTGATRAFLERLLFQYLSYDADRTPLTPAPIHSALIFTMNAPESAVERIGYGDKFRGYEGMLQRLLLGSSRSLVSAETLQVRDYGRYRMSMINEEPRKARRETVFPQECQKAFDIGAELAGL